MWKLWGKSNAARTFWYFWLPACNAPFTRLSFTLNGVKSSVAELNCESIASLALLAAEVENFSMFQAPTQSSASQVALCKYSSADTSQSRSCNTRKVCDWLLSLWQSHQHQASDTPSIKRWCRPPCFLINQAKVQLTWVTWQPVTSTFGSFIKHKIIVQTILYLKYFQDYVVGSLLASVFNFSLVISVFVQLSHNDTISVCGFYRSSWKEMKAGRMQLWSAQIVFYRMLQDEDSYGNNNAVCFLYRLSGCK